MKCFMIENFLAMLQTGLSSQQVMDIAMASSAVWALLSGCRKVSLYMCRCTLLCHLDKSFTQKITFTGVVTILSYLTGGVRSVIVYRLDKCYI